MVLHNLQQLLHIQVKVDGALEVVSAFTSHMEEAILDILHNNQVDLDLLPSLGEEHRTEEWCWIFNAIERALGSYLLPFDYFDFHTFGWSVIPVNFYFSEKHSSFL